MKPASNNVRTLGQIHHPCDNQQSSHVVATGSISLMRWAGLAGSCFGVSWSVSQVIYLAAYVCWTPHSSPLTSCLLDIPLGAGLVGISSLKPLHQTSDALPTPHLLLRLVFPV